MSFHECAANRCDTCPASKPRCEDITKPSGGLVMCDHECHGGAS